MENEAKIKSEKLAYWYFRLNGFLTIRNFVVHPDYGREQRTDVDILGVRFPYRASYSRIRWMTMKYLPKIKDKPAEVTIRPCKLNNWWRHPDSRSRDMHRIISFIGAFRNVDEVAEKLNKNGTGTYENDFYISLFCVGRQPEVELQKSHPNIPQVTWDRILKFMYNRFKNYEPQKSAHS